LYSFHHRTVHIRGGIYRGPSLRNLYTNDHYTSLLNQYNPSKLQGRSCLFTLCSLHSSRSCRLVPSSLRSLENSCIGFFWFRMLAKSEGVFVLESCQSSFLSRAKSIHSERSWNFLFASVFCRQTLSQQLMVWLQSSRAAFYGEVKPPTIIHKYITIKLAYQMPLHWCWYFNLFSSGTILPLT